MQRFRFEAETVAKLDHPHIVPIYDIGEDQNRHFFTMKLIEGFQPPPICGASEEPARPPA